MNTEVICIFREEKEGVSGLKKVLANTKTPFTLAIDKDKNSTKAYSTKQRTFDNFVIDAAGNIKAIIPGTLKDRATADELVKELKAIEK